MPFALLPASIYIAMHEFSICEGLLDTVLAEMRKVNPPARRLLKTRIVVGAMRQVVPEYLAFAYESLTKGTPAEGSALDIVPAPVAAKCRNCGWQGESANPSFQCVKCQSYDLDIEGGTELYLESLEVEQDD